MARRLVRVPRLGRYLTPRGDEFVSVEALGGIAVVTAAIAALVWANVAPGSYGDAWSSVLSVGTGDATLALDLRHWVNDGLMAVFFFVVALEIKREIVVGELRDPRRAALPIAAAAGGMVLPAVIFVAANAGTGSARGWAIPMATDIAIAVGVLSLLGALVHPGAKLFLLTLAIVDDVGAIVVIALFYTGAIGWEWFAAAAAVLGLVLVLRVVGAKSPWMYALPGLALWLCVHESGIHATIAGVALGLVTPARPVGGRHVLESLEHRLHPWSSFLIVPVFALANGGVQLTGSALSAVFSGGLGIGIIAGLFAGKTLGILGTTAAALRLRIGRLPEGVDLHQIAAIGMVAGIGFTVALFVADLSYSGARLEQAKAAVLVASLVAAVVGASWLRLVASRHRPDGDRDPRRRRG